MREVCKKIQNELAVFTHPSIEAIAIYVAFAAVEKYFAIVQHNSNFDVHLHVVWYNFDTFDVAQDKINIIECDGNKTVKAKWNRKRSVLH